MPRAERRKRRFSRPSVPVPVRVSSWVIPLALGLVLMELGARVLLPDRRVARERERALPYRSAVFARHRLAPVGRLVRVSESRAFFINDLGYRGPPFTPEKPEGGVRIFVLGGSAVFDPQASDEGAHLTRDWPHDLQRLLERRGHGHVEVINAGVPGYASFDSLGRFYAQHWLYQPDWVVIDHGWNDIKYWARREISPQTPLIDRVHAYARRRNPFLGHRGPLDRLLSHSRVYSQLRYAWLRSRHKRGLEGALPEAERRRDAYAPWGARQLRLDLELLVSAVRHVGASPVLVTQPTLVASGNGPAERAAITYAYQELTHDALVRAFAETHALVRELGRERDVPVLDLAPELSGRLELFEDAIHLNEAGGDAVAERLAAWLGPRLADVRARP